VPVTKTSNMKTTKLSIVFLLGCTILSQNIFGQNNQFNQSTSPNSTTTQNTSPASSANIRTQRPVTGNSNLTISFSNPVSTQNGAGQHSCKTHELNEKHYQERGLLQEFNQDYMSSAQSMANYNTPKTSGVNEISVIFHVVHNPNNPAENVSNAAIMAVFNDLVDDYQAVNVGPVRSGFGFTPANSNINFCLATQTPTGAPLTEMGVIRVSTTEDWYDSDNGEENKMKSTATGGSDIWNRNNYLNVWICDISNGAGFGTAGYAYRPTPGFLPGATIDGIVLDYDIGMGGNVLTHEVGHYLGLDHTWGGSGSCASDDGFTDTPNTIGPADNQPGFSCGMANFQTCGPEVQYENFMDYATGCSAMYTQEQADYQLSILQGIRGSLLLSPGCDPTNTPPISAFNSVPAGPVIIPVNASVSFIDQSTNFPTGWLWTISGTQGVDWQWINTTNQNTQNPVAEFYTIGTYDVSLTASNGFGADATPAFVADYVTVVGAATGIACDTLRNYLPAEPMYTITGGTGYIPGNLNVSGQNALEWAEPYTALASTQVKGLEFIPGPLTDNGGNVIFKVYDDGGGIPGTIQATEVVALSTLTSYAWNHIDFTTPYTVTGQFWVGYELSYNGTDTLTLLSNSDGALPSSYTWMKLASGGWTDAGLTYSNSRFAFIMDVLTSNGDDPIMDFTASDNQICSGGDILVDGSISTNNSTYEWYVTDDPVTGYYETSSSSSNIFNFPYPAGNYNIFLFGDGSCRNTGVVLPIQLDAAVTATVTTTPTTCGDNNGSITITSPAGGDGTYYYSLDDVNYQVSNTFTNLAAGTYEVYVGTNGSGCVTSYTVNVGNSTPFVATASQNTSVCPGGSATITAGGGVSYQWYDGSTVIATTPSTTVTPASTTQYTCVVTNGAGCTSTVYTTVTINPLPAAPTISASGPTAICNGQTVDLTSSYPTGNVWSTTETTATITVSTAGSYSVTHTNANGCTSAASATTTVTVNPGPTIASGTVTNPSTCSTATGSIQVTGTGTGDVSWTGTSTGTNTGVTLPNVISNLGAGSYDITFTTSAGCISNTITVVLTDPTPPATPTITASGSTAICSGNSVTLTSSAGTGNTWSTTETTNSIVVSSAGSYTVTVTDGNGCSATSAPTVITSSPSPSAPTITASGPTTFCSGGSVDLTSSSPTGNTWSTTETTSTITVNAAGSYTVTFTDGNGCTATSTPITITINNSTTIASGTVTDPSACATATGSIEVTGTGTGDLNWTGTSPGSTTGITLPYVIPNLIAGSYNITFTSNTGCISNTITVVVTDPNPPATPTISASGSTTFCSGQSVDLTSSAGSGNTWSTTETTTTITVASSGSYTVTFTDGFGCTATSAPLVVTVNSNPAAPTVSASGPTTFCAGGSVDLTSSYPSGNNWSTTETTNPITVSSTGNYTVTYTNGNGCTSTSAPMSVTVNNAPTIASGTVTNPSACSTATGSIQVTGSGTGNLSWTGTSTGTNTGVTLPNVINNLAAGSYDITFTSSGCPSNTITVVVTDPNPPATPTITASGPTSFCTGGSVNLTSSAGTGNTWSNSQTTNAITVSTSGSYTVTVTDGAGCSSTSAPVNVTENSNPSPPVISTSGSTVICGGSSITLTSSQSSGNVWSTTESTSQIVVSTAGTYSVTYTDGNGCSSTSSDMIITSGSAPTIATGTITPPSSCGSATGSIQVTGSGTGDINWGGAGSGSATSITLPYTITNLATGSYTITFSDGNGGCGSNTLNVPLSDATPPAQPTISVNGSPCNGEVVTLTSSQGSGNVWSTTQTSSSINVTTSGSYSVTYTAANGCSSTSTPVTLTFNAPPSVSLSSFNTVCVYNDPFALNGGSPAGGSYSGTGVSGASFTPNNAGTGNHLITYVYTDGNGCSGSASSNITVDGCASIFENDLDVIKVFPNPMSNNLTIECEGDFSIEIYDTKGRLIEVGDFKDSVNLNTIAYDSGLYILSVKSLTMNKTMRVIKN